MDFYEAHMNAEVVRELQPRRDVAVVVEARDEDLVAGRERPSERTREREVERRHVLAEDRLPGLAAEEPGRGRVRQLDELVAAAALRALGCEVDLVPTLHPAVDIVMFQRLTVELAEQRGREPDRIRRDDPRWAAAAKAAKADNTA